MFTFHRIGWINGDDKEVSGWLLLIETDEHMKKYLEYHAYDVANIWLKIKDSPENKSGHTFDNRADAYKAILTMKMERDDKKRISMPEAVNYIEMVSTKTLINIFYNEGSVYVNVNGGCRDTRIRNDDRMHELIFETRTSNDLVFPLPKDEVDEVKITNWPLCPHFYLSVNGRNIEVDGVAKWKTIKGAEDAKRRFERRRKAAKKK